MLATVLETLRENSHANGTGFLFFMTALFGYIVWDELKRGRPALRKLSKFKVHGRPRYKRRKGSDPVCLGFYGSIFLALFLMSIIQWFDVE